MYVTVDMACTTSTERCAHPSCEALQQASVPPVHKLSHSHASLFGKEVTVLQLSS